MGELIRLDGWRYERDRRRGSAVLDAVAMLDGGYPEWSGSVDSLGGDADPVREAARAVRVLRAVMGVQDGWLRGGGW